ncbi:MAG TPA: tetratricopeptide repeat protein [Dongiaceae bacterium]|nr:tetratricopeptide repeat protein [Dongiaceae bacterium]
MSDTMMRVAAFAVVLTLFVSMNAYAADTEETPASADLTDLDTARQLVDGQQYEEALPLLLHLDEKGRSNPDVLNLIGFSLRKTGKMADALGYYQRALALDPEHLGANEYLGELYLEIKQPAKAKERLAVLQKACGDCEEFEDLQAQIDRYAAQ